MDKSYSYQARAGWDSQKGSLLEADAISPAISFAAPPEFGGRAGVWTPEHLLLGAVATCYVATFRAIAGFSKLNFGGIEVAVDGEIEKQEGGLRFTAITVKPVCTIEKEEDRDRAQKILEKAERGCLIARSLSCPVGLEARIELEEPVAAE
jgi:peroxiredoxin-like protein